MDTVLSRHDGEVRGTQERGYHGRCHIPFETVRRPSRRAMIHIVTTLKNVGI